MTTREIGDCEGLAQVARALVALRRQRTRFFAAPLFGEAGWDMLLTLYIADVEGRVINDADLYLASAEPPSTARRWLESLRQHQLVSVVIDEHGHRVIALTVEAIEGVGTLLADFREALRGA